MMKTVTAIDIGTSAVKVVQMERSKGKVHIVNFGIESYPRHEGTEMDSEIRISCLKGLLTNLGIKSKSAVVSIPRAFLTLKRLTNFPRSATADDVTKLIPLQVEQELPLELENSIYDYYGMKRTESGVSVELVAARRDFVENYMKILRAVGIKIKTLYPSTFALYNLQLQKAEESKEKIIGVADIGACRTELFIVRGNSLAFSTSFKWGGDDLTRLYQKGLMIDFKRAEEHKVEFKREPDELEPQLSLWLERLASEISRSLYSFSSLSMIGSERRSVDQLWLCGGCANIKNIDFYLSQWVKVETCIWKPLNTYLLKGAEGADDLEKSDELKGDVSVALGLGVALLGTPSGIEAIDTDIDNIDISISGVNLIPFEMKKRLAELKRKVLIFATSALIGLLIILTAWWIKTQISVKESKTNVSKLEVKSNQTKLQNIRELLTKDLVMQSMAVRQVSPLDLIKELSERLPDRKKMALTSLSLDKNGKVIVNLEANSNSAISEAIQAINSAPVFERVEAGAISKTEKDKRQVLQIQVSFRVKPNAKSLMDSAKTNQISQISQAPTTEKSQPQAGVISSDEGELKRQLEQKKKEMLGVK